MTKDNIMDGLTLYQKNKDLLKCFYINFVKYPNSEKHCLVADIKESLFDYMKLIIRAQKKYYKKTTLQDADIELQLLRNLNELSYELKYIDEKRFKLTSMQLNECGKLLGGWIKKMVEIEDNRR